MASSRALKNYILSELRSRGVSATKDGMETLVELARNTPQDKTQQVFEELLDATMKEDCEFDPQKTRQNAPAESYSDHVSLASQWRPSPVA